MIKKLKSLSYPQMIALGYFIIIAAGTLLLMLPFSSRSGISPGVVDSLFTAASATCVTGLVVFDTYIQWSVFGQIVILLLIQIGGLGFMTIITMFSFFLGRKIGLFERGLLRESISTMYLGGIVRLTKKVLLGTLLFEGLGAIVLSIRFVPRMGLLAGIYNGVFHSVSSFCNAGFDIMGKYGAYSSVTSYSDDPVVCLTIIALIVIGGIGFFVWDDIWKYRHHFKKYQLHTKIVLSTTAILIVAGAITFYVLEMDNTLKGKPLGDQIVNSLFCSVTPRTAGFNSVDTAKLSPAANILTVMLMYIGASPGSTGGGIKTTAFAVIIISAWSSLHNTKGENVFGRRLEDNSLRRACTVAVVNLSLIIFATMLISVTNPAVSSNSVLFEATSAISTVGLSRGITSSLNTLARIVIVLLMYAGRVGSLSFALFFRDHKAPPPVQSPAEKIIIG